MDTRDLDVCSFCYKVKLVRHMLSSMNGVMGISYCDECGSKAAPNLGKFLKVGRIY